MKRIIWRFLLVVVVVAISILLWTTLGFRDYLFSLQIEDWKLFLDLLGKLLSWPSIVLVISLVFLTRFRAPIATFLGNLRSFSAGPVGVTTQQPTAVSNTSPEEGVPENLREEGIHLTEKQVEEIKREIDVIKGDKDKLEQESKDNKSLISYLVESREQYEFAYLTFFLVNNSKAALKWIFERSHHRATKDYFNQTFVLPEAQASPDQQKAAIVNALLDNELLDKSSEMLTVTEKGERFLRHIKSIS